MAVVDDKTPRLGLLLPFTDNFLQDDVERLRDTFGLLDVLVVTRDKTTGKIADDMLSSVIAKLDAQGKLLTAQIPSSVVQKGPDGKIDASLMPSIAVVDTFPVPNEASMLGLQCERGDIAIREDLGKTFILTQMPPSVLSNWRELTSTNVTSVNGQTGAITGLAKSGVNNDITGLNALSGPLRLGGDAAGDYDAVTLKQLRAASGGAGGASMNGVMNNFIGAVEWFNGSRAKIPAGYIAADGQGLAKSSVPDLWAAVKSGMLNSVTEELWQNSGITDNTQSNRGMYSVGTGISVDTGDFRVPDLNGAQIGSRQHNYLSSLGIGSQYQSGYMDSSSAPQIRGWFPGQITSGFETASGGAILGTGPDAGKFKDKSARWDSYTVSSYGFDFDAARSSSVYRRNDGELNPNAAYGIWIIRASGTFQAQNTNFNVLNSDTTTPSNGVQVAGGKIGSRYSIAGVDQIEGQIWAEKTIGSTESRIVFSAANLPLNIRNWMSFSTSGNLVVTGEYRGATAALSGKGKALAFQATGIGYEAGIYKSASAASQDESGVNCIYGVSGIDSSTYCYQVRIPNQSYQHVWRLDHDGVSEYFSIRSDKKIYTPLGVVALEGSDIRLKDKLDEVSPGASTRIAKMTVHEYVMGDNKHISRGFIAQEMQKIDPLYTFYGGTGTKKDGSTFEILNVDSRAVLADAILAIQALQIEIAELKSKLAD